MPNTREKLIELLEVDLSGSDGYEPELIADYLIANGVTLQEHDHHWATEQAYKNGYEAGKPKWIPVSERLPEYFGTFIVAIFENDPDNTTYTDCADYDYFSKIWRPIGYFAKGCEITHWMPLPEPPKGE